MRHFAILGPVAVGLLSALPGAQAGGIYPKNSPVLQVEAKDYERLIAQSNHTSIVEFYAPWCGHCQNLKPAYEKAAKNLDGLAKVAAINCDDDANKPFCGQMGVQGFPTLKIVRPVEGKSKPKVIDYQGQRTASAIVEAVVGNINNHVNKVEDKNIDDFLDNNKDTPKALLFSEKGTTSALLKAVAIDFLGGISIGQVRNTQKKVVDMFGVTKFPTLVLLPGGTAPTEGIVYDGENKKPEMVKFLSQAAEPNPDPAPLKKSTKPKKESKPKDKEATPKDKEATPTSEPPTQAAPVIVETALPISALTSLEKLVKECLSEKSSTCVLALVPGEQDDKAQQALTTLSELAHKHALSKRNLFPFFEVSKNTEGVADFLKPLGLSGNIELIAVNGRRGWWRHYQGDDFGHEGIERWIDAIRMSEGVKKKLPEGMVAASVDEPAKPASPEASSEPTPDATEDVSSEEATPLTPESEATVVEEESTSTKGADPEPEPETAKPEEADAEPAQKPVVVHEEL